MAMINHNDYGRLVLRQAAGIVFTHRGRTVAINYGAGRSARIDGTINHTIAVEVESRVSKQVRGAVLDLICHPYPKKLLLLLPVHMHKPHITANQCRFILARFLDPANFRVVLLTGSGSTFRL
jgi:hypothetical protein